MYIEKLHIDTFGRLNDVDFDFSSGINIIEGANESGKSTIAEFIKFVLYGMNSEEKSRMLSWRTGGAAGSITIRTETAYWRIERAILGTREALQLIDAKTNMPIRHVFDKVSPGEYLFGVNADMFAATAFVSQIGGTQSGGTSVAEGIENILFSGDESINTKRALSKLDSARVALLHKNEKGGRIHEIDLECAELEVALADAVKVHSEILEKEAQLYDSKANYERALKKAETCSAQVEQFETRVLLELYERRKHIEARIAVLRAELEKNGAHDITELRAMETLNAKATNLRHELEEVALREAADAIEVEDDPLLDEYLELGGREILENEYNRCRSKSLLFSVIGAMLLILAPLIALFGILPLGLSAGLKIAAYIGAVAFAIPGIALIVIGAINRKRAAVIEESYDFDALDEAAQLRVSAKESADCAAMATVEARKRYDEVCDEIRRTFGCEEHMLVDRINKLNEKLRSTDSVKSEYDKNVSVKAQMDSQLRHYSEAELKERLDPNVDITGIDVSKLPALRREAAFSGKMADSLEKHIAELEKTLAGLYPISKDPAKLTEEIESLKSEREALAKKHRAYILATEKLIEAGENLRGSISPRLASEAAAQMAHITDGKYRELGVGGDLSLTALTEYGTKSVTSLSSGTRDAAYLCLRLALISLLYRKEQPMLVLDEAFVRQDDERLSGMLKLLRIRNIQSFIFTANHREAAAMESIGDFNAIQM